MKIRQSKAIEGVCYGAGMSSRHRIAMSCSSTL